MTHEEFQDRLDAFVDGELDPAARHAMEEHAGTCPSCAAALDATRALLEDARRLPDVIEPKQDLWPRLERALQAGEAGVASAAAAGATAAPAEATVLPMRRVQPLAGSRAHHRMTTTAWLVAASLAVGVAALWLRSRDPLAPRTAATAVEREAAFNGLVSGLELECRGAGVSLQASLRLPGAVRPGTALAAWTPVLSDAVAILDQSIAETRSALALTPEDTALQALLAARYRQKLEILGAALASVERT